MYDLYEELQTKTRQLDASIKQLRINGTAYAEAEREYKVKLREEVLKLRDEGMAVGIIDKTIYGVPSIAQLRFKRDCAKVVYDANQEAIMSIKLQMRIIENQLGREWSNEINNQ